MSKRFSSSLPGSHVPLRNNSNSKDRIFNGQTPLPPTIAPLSGGFMVFRGYFFGVFRGPGGTQILGHFLKIWGKSPLTATLFGVKNAKNLSLIRGGGGGGGYKLGEKTHPHMAATLAPPLSPSTIALGHQIEAGTYPHFLGIA